MSLDLDLLTFQRFFQRLHACTARESGVSSGLGTRLLCPEKTITSASLLFPSSDTTTGLDKLAHAAFQQARENRGAFSEKKWGGKRDSNPRPPGPQPGALTN